jgi:hypothetical protein
VDLYVLAKLRFDPKHYGVGVKTHFGSRVCKKRKLNLFRDLDWAIEFLSAVSGYWRRQCQSGYLLVEVFAHLDLQGLEIRI